MIISEKIFYFLVKRKPTLDQGEKKLG